MAANDRAVSSDERPDFSLKAREEAGYGLMPQARARLRQESDGEKIEENESGPSFVIRDPSMRDEPNRDTAQILALLNMLGERMIRSEADRHASAAALKEYQEMLQSLEGRAGETERAFIAMRKRQKEIETQQLAQLERLEKTAQFADRLEETLIQQARLQRRLDKMTQDRAGLIRKLETIEESVIETQEALRQYAVPSVAPQHQNRGAAARPVRGKNIFTFFTGWWRSSLHRQYAGIAVGVVLAIGLSLFVMRGADHTSPVADVTIPPVAYHDPARLPMPSPTTNHSAPTSDMAPDILNADDDELSHMFDTDPDALASALNALEPESLPEAAPAAMIEKVVETVKEPVVAPTPKMQSAPKSSAAELSASPAKIFLNAQAGTGKITDRIEADKKLPGVVRQVEKQAFAGTPEAQHDLAAIYTAGHGGVEVDYVRAALWFREAALNGVANARYNLGVLHHQGLGVEKNVSMAIGWYQAASALNHPEAQYNLGIAHIEGIGVPYDAEKAAIYFRDSAQQGVMEAAYNLGLIHENGLLGKAAPEQAILWYKRAADAGSPEAAAAMNQLTRALKLSDSDVARILRDQPAALPAASVPPAQTAPATNTPAPRVETAPAATTTPTTQRDYALIAQIQEQLARRGLLPVSIDHSDLARTQDAIRRYQRQNALAQDGRISDALLLHMLSHTEQAATGTASSLSTAAPLRPTDRALPDYDGTFTARPQ